MKLLKLSHMSTLQGYGACNMDPSGFPFLPSAATNSRTPGPHLHHSAGHTIKRHGSETGNKMYTKFNTERLLFCH